ncbi:MAG: 50S ribosomal protein L24 [Bacteroidia bacterium]|jgi:large subunit ribosomal protein L24
MERKFNTQPKLKIRKGDMVQVIAGDDKGKKGRVLEVISETNRVLVEGINIVSRHTKPNAQNQQGGIIKKEAPLNISNVKVLDKGGKATRVGRKLNDAGKLVRYSKKSGEVID